MAKKYYYIIAALRDYGFDVENKGFDAVIIREDIYEGLEGRDKEYLRDFYAYYDILNIIAVIENRRYFNVLGNFSRDQLTEEIRSPEELPGYLKEILVEFRNSARKGEAVTIETGLPRALWSAFYGYCHDSECRFLREWYDFDKDMKNITTAITARRMGMDIASGLVGDSGITESLIKSSAIDFGLKNEVDYIDKLLSILDESNILEKERKLDLIRWNKAEELTETDYFDINRILAYCAKINIIHRWMSLDRNVGAEMFRKMIEGISDKSILDNAVFEIGNSRVRNTEIE